MKSKTRRNGDIHVIFEDGSYRMEMWNEGAWEYMGCFTFEFDVHRHLNGFERLPESQGDRHLCGLFRKENIDQRPLFQRGYAAVFLSHERFKQELDGSITREWGRGFQAGTDDQWLLRGYVNTGRRYPSTMEPVEQVQDLL